MARPPNPLWLFVAFGCRPQYPDSGNVGDTGVAQLRLDVEWTIVGIRAAVSGPGVDPLAPAMLGMAETGGREIGWYGEDCRTAQRGKVVCHEEEAGRVEIDSVTDPRLVVSGRRTLFNRTMFAVTTHALTLEDGRCFAWGHAPDYFDCVPMEEMDGGLVESDDNGVVTRHVSKWTAPEGA